MEPAELAVSLKKLVSGLLLIPTGPLIAILVGMFVARRRPRLGLGLVACGALVLLVLSVPWVSLQLAEPGEVAFPPLDAHATLPADAAIVVLGGGAQNGALDYAGDETVNAITLQRLRAAARLARRTQLPVLVTGGRLGPMKRSEGALMAESLRDDFGVPVRWEEDAALDTYDNARLAVPLLKAAGIGTAVLVTDVGHMARAMRFFEAGGMRVVPAPTDYYASQETTLFSFVPNTLAMRRSALLVHEWVGQAWARLRGPPEPGG